jgi:TonB family protein
MTQSWAKWETLVINGVFPLRRFLSRSNHSVVFLTESGAAGSPDAAIKLIPAHPTRSEAQLSHWRMVAGLTHPRLVRLFDSGACEIAGHPFLFVVMEYADQTLAQLLHHRPLDAAEVEEVLPPVLDALSFIHDKGLVHRKLKPPNFLVVNDQLKLASDSIQPAAEARPGSKLSVYDPPEANNGKISAAGDIWALGITLVEALTQRTPSWPDRRPDALSLPPGLPMPIADIARRCLRSNPGERPTSRDLRSPATPTPTAQKTPAPAVPDPAPAAVPPTAPPASPFAAPPASLLASAAAPPESSSPAPKPAEAPGRTPLPMIAIVAILLVAAWGVYRLVHHQRTVPPTNVATPQLQPPPPPPRAASPATSATTADAALYQAIPDMSSGARATIRGRIKVTVLATVDQSGQVVKTSLKNGAPSRYFDRLATEAAGRWQFTPASNPAVRKWLIHFEFTHGGANASAEGPQP